MGLWWIDCPADIFALVACVSATPAMQTSAPPISIAVTGSPRKRISVAIATMICGNGGKATVRDMAKPKTDPHGCTGHSDVSSREPNHGRKSRGVNSERRNARHAYLRRDDLHVSKSSNPQRCADLKQGHDSISCRRVIIARRSGLFNHICRFLRHINHDVVPTIELVCLPAIGASAFIEGGERAIPTCREDI